MNQTVAPYVLTNENVAAFWSIGILWLPLATGALTGNALTLIEQRMHNGSGPPSHLHAQDEGFYVIDGSCTFNAGGQTVKAGAGTFIHIPRDTSHSFTIDEDPSHVLNFYFPAGFEHILLSIAAPAQSRTVPAFDAVPMPPPEFANELAREYGQTKDLGMPWVDIPNANNIVTVPSKTNPFKPFGNSVADAPSFWSQGILWSMLATGEQTDGTYSVIEELCPKNSGAPPHWHEQDEAFYLLDGEATFQMDDQVLEIKAGAFLFIPRGTVHSFRIDSEIARLLNFYTPAGFERTIIETAQPAVTRTLPPKDLTENVDPDKMKALFKSVGMHVVAVPDFLRDK